MISSEPVRDLTDDPRLDEVHYGYKNKDADDSLRRERIVIMNLVDNRVALLVKVVESGRTATDRDELIEL